MTPLEDQLHCFGYFGFGGGYAMVKYGLADDDGRQLYCGSKCPRSGACWENHRTRVRELYPDLARIADKIAQKHHGAAYMHEWLKQSKQTAENFCEPFSSVMMGNIADGAAVAHGKTPKDRGDWSLTWPLTLR